MNRRTFLSGMAAMAAASRLGAQELGSDRLIMDSVPVFAHFTTWHNGPLARNQVAVMPLRRQENYVHGYDSTNPAVIQQQNEEMLSHGIMPMLSWWDTPEHSCDPFMDAYFSVDGVRPKSGILYGETGFRQQANGEVDFNDEWNVSKFAADMEHLEKKYFNPHRNDFFQVDGKPVVFIWISHIFKGGFANAVARAKELSNVYLIGSEYMVPLDTPKNVQPGLEQKVAAMDAISSYGIYNRRYYGEQLSHGDKSEDFFSDYVMSIGAWTDWLKDYAPNTRIMLPLGFSYDDRHIPGRYGDHFRSDDATARDFAEMVQGLITNPCSTGRILPFTYVTSYNEHYEGSSIEPTEEFGDLYLRILKETFMKPVSIQRTDKFDYCTANVDRGNPRD